MRSTVIGWLQGARTVVLAVVDSLAWVAAVYLATGLRFETLMSTPHVWLGESNRIPLYGVLAVAAVAIAVHVVLAWAFRLHQGRSALGSFEEIFLLGSILITAGAVATLFNALVDPSFVPRSTPITASFIALVFCAWPRALWRVLVSQTNPATRRTTSTPVLVVGAGEAGRQLVRSMQRDADLTWRPIGFVDDDPRKKHLRHRGVRVMGTTEQLGRVASRAQVATIVVAIPSATSETISRINDLAVAADLDVKVLPGVGELMSGANVRSMRDLKPEDLLGRHQIKTDLESIANSLAGKRILVTGAGGSIGSELCRQIVRLCPASLVMLDRDESALHSLMLSIYGRADLESRDVVLANIREADRVREVFDIHRPQVVFHAAALKHVNMLERHAAEAVKTNVFGTLNLLEAADEFGVERFVNISTDKAADPINVLGYTKRIAEGLTAAYADRPTGVFLSVRFGNVLGTSGSVLRTFVAQIDAGGPVTVTHQEVTRYFMTIDEAVQLVIQAAAIGRDGEALVLDMGEPVKIVEVARQMVDQSRRPIDIVFTGLKPGEKLHEVLFGSGEVDVRNVHPLVSHVCVPGVTGSQALDIPLDLENLELVEILANVAHTMDMSDRENASP